jgi:hypothetical protein
LELHEPEGFFISMPNRVLRDWTSSEVIDQLSEGAEVFFTRLIMKADDYGSFYANPKLIRSALFPLKEYKDTQITKWVNECLNAGVIFLYEIENREYIRIINFGQRLRNMRSTFPQPADNSLTTRRESRPETKRNESETETNQKANTTFAADESATLEQRSDLFMRKVAEYKDTYDKGLLRAFFDYWTETNEGGRRMRFEMQKVFDIKKRLVTWSKNEKSKPLNGYGQQTTNKHAQHTASAIAAFAQTYGPVFGIRPDGQSFSPDANSD